MGPDSHVQRATMAYIAPLLGLLAVVAVSRAQVQVCANAAGKFAILTSFRYLQSTYDEFKGTLVRTPAACACATHHRTGSRHRA